MSAKRTNVFVIALIGAFLSAVPFEWATLAQPGGGRRRGGPSSPPTNPSRGPESPRGSSAQGLTRIIKFKPFDPEQYEEEFLGYLLVKPVYPGSDVERVLVPELDRFKLTVADREIDIDDYELFLAKGMMCAIQTRTVDSSTVPLHIAKVLTQIELCVIEIEGRIKKLTDDLVRLRAKPLRDQPWPQLQAEHTAGAGRSSTADQDDPRRHLIVRFSIVEDLTSFVDEDGWSADLSDFEEGQAVRATVVVGRPRGILLKMMPAPMEGDDRG